MFGNNMTGDPNQQNTSSMFQYDSFPSSSTSNYVHNPFVAKDIMPNYQGTPQTPVGILSSNFCFGTPRPMQSLVQFPFQTERQNFSSNLPFNQGMRCKRKTDSPPLQPCKQHITEEKMAEHMSKLHISSETITSTKESDTIRNKRLYMCEEMRKLQSEAILPQCLISRIQRPCTALVLWTPPNQLIQPTRRNVDVDLNENNNAEDEPDNNRMENDVIEMDNMEMDK